MTSIFGALERRARTATDMYRLEHCAKLLGKSVVDEEEAAS
jgi:hypothetical protein